jgi:hypothetical protein
MVVHQRHPQGTEGRRKAQKATVKKAPTKKKMSAARESSVTGKFGKSKGSPGGEESGSVIQQSWMDTICDSAASGSVITPLAGFAGARPHLPGARKGGTSFADAGWRFAESWRSKSAVWRSRN